MNLVADVGINFWARQMTEIWSDLNCIPEISLLFHEFVLFFFFLYMSFSPTVIVSPRRLGIV